MTTDFLPGHDAEASELLSEHEVSLMRAFRNADQRAREDAIALLVSHKQGEKKNSSHGSGDSPVE